MILKTLSSSVLFTVLSISSLAQTGSIEVTITGIENNEGVIMIGLYNSEADFPDFDKAFSGAAPAASKEGVVHSFANISPGKYAIAVWHDEDEDKVLDKNLLGIPKENYGFSNNVFGTFGPPDFKDAAIEVFSDETQVLRIILK